MSNPRYSQSSYGERPRSYRQSYQSQQIPFNPIPYITSESQQQSSFDIVSFLKLIIILVVLSVIVYFLFFKGLGGIGESIGDFYKGIVGGVGKVGGAVGELVDNNEKCQKKYNDPNAFGSVGGNCFKCPDGMTRNGLVPFTDPAACIGVGDKQRAHVYGNPSVCPSGFKKDLTLDICYKCPRSHPVRTAANVRSNKACGKNFLGIGGTVSAEIQPSNRGCSSFTRKSGHGTISRYVPTGVCFSCPNGYLHDILKDPNDGSACVRKAQTSSAIPLGLV